MVEEYFFTNDQYQPPFSLAKSPYPTSQAIESDTSDNCLEKQNGQELNECRALASEAAPNIRLNPVRKYADGVS